MRRHLKTLLVIGFTLAFLGCGNSGEVSDPKLLDAGIKKNQELVNEQEKAFQKENRSKRN
ncbi:hypothetical protein [Zavarzinella formosa]|uniref:hypothetical protein n=1 Tax=Zavarzinella formosa TaxID=360055 RepID=UPI000317B85B|nr:hypothetical protein [Zavarzinella formosa]